jgi:cytochrome b subunit of formate dehydrogenase
MATQPIDRLVGGDLIYRHRRPVRAWHWLNALAVIVLLMSGMMIFNAHPHLYWAIRRQ